MNFRGKKRYVPPEWPLMRFVLTRHSDSVSYMLAEYVHQISKILYLTRAAHDLTLIQIVVFRL